VERSGLDDKERNSNVIIFELVELSLFPDIRVPKKKVNKRRRIKIIKRKVVIKSCIVKVITT
jgi:hypothetical protein